METSEARFAYWSAAHAAALHRFAYLLCGDWHDAEDLVQEVLTKASLRWGRIERIEHPEAYVRAMVVNECRSMWRRPWRRTQPADIVEPIAPDATEGLASRSELMDAVRQLPLRQRAAVVLRYYEDLSEAETAAVLGCSVGTVKSQTHKGLKSLQQSLTKEGSRC